ncbi:hypothetical protein MMC07_009469 [Pseudocyphellaria aurata]|nr:hypothetical protein [Pseudocyphellaria aurata]
MALFLDLDGDDGDDDDRNGGNEHGTCHVPPHHEPSPGSRPDSKTGWQRCPQSETCQKEEETNDAVQENESVRLNPNINGFSAAISPRRGRGFGKTSIITQIAHSIDLNTLHALSRTCRQIRANLLQYRTQLIRQTLRCSSEETIPIANIGDGIGVIRATDGRNTRRNLGEYIDRAGGYIPCARDLVSECRQCEKVVCRNCTLKPPSASALPSRRRRLCPACLAAPLPLLHPTAAAARSPCTCPLSVHLCHPCGSPLSIADKLYAHVRASRTRSRSAGIDEGDYDVRCWRLDACISAEEVDFEFEVTHSQGADAGGYETQDAVGVGAAVKRKAVRKMTVGGRLVGEEEETERSWCRWCERVILGADESSSS